MLLGASDHQVNLTFVEFLQSGISFLVHMQQNES